MKYSFGLIFLMTLFGSSSFAGVNFDDLNLAADFRFRNEWISQQAKDSDRIRQRIRARISLLAPVTENIDLGFRLATGPMDVSSRNQSFDDNSSAKGLNLDQAYFDWTMCACGSIQLIGGKMKNPFYKTGKTELLWDGDLTPEGLNLKTKFGDHTINLGGFWLEERADDPDTLYGALQWVWNIQMESLGLKFGAGYYSFSQMKGNALLTSDAGKTDAKGNTVSAGNYATDFAIAEVLLEVSTDIGELPFTFFASNFNNGEADKKNKAYVLGLIFGKAKKQGSYSINYNFRRTEADAVIGSISDGDFFGGNTDSTGHQIKIAYVPVEKVKIGAMYLTSEGPLDGSQTKYERAQLDFIFNW